MADAAAPAPPPPGAPRAVLDTNVWLDVYLFDDPRARALAQALHGGALRALRSAPTDAELQRVLARPAFRARWDEAQAAQALARWQDCAASVDELQLAPWTCRDADDQKFLDLAVTGGAAWLFTKDRALLELARKAGPSGLCICLPQGCPGS